MPLFDRSNLKIEAFEPDFCSATGSKIEGKIIAVHFLRYPKDSSILPHSYNNEHISAILSGRAEFIVNEQKKTIGPGEALLIKVNAIYSGTFLEDTEVIIFEYIGSEKRANVNDDIPVFYKWDEMQGDYITPSYSSAHGPVAKGHYIEVGVFSYPAGSVANRHAHPNEQIQVLLKGAHEGIIGEEKFRAGEGSVSLIPTYVEHQGRILEDYVTLNCKNSVEGWNVHDAKWEK